MNEAAGEIEIAREDAAAIDDLRPLWLALRDQHGEVMPQLGPVRDDEDSWRVRRETYEKALATAGAFLLVARRGGRAIGYAVVESDHEESPTWPRSGLWGFLESLSVAPDARGEGVGGMLLDAVRREAAREGFDRLSTGAVAGNAGAIRFYERHGFAQDTVLMVDSEYKPGQSGKNGVDDGSG